MALIEHHHVAEHPDLFESLEHFVDRWPHVVAWPMFGWPDSALRMLRVDEYREDGSLVVRAEVPGIDRDKDLEVTASEGVLHICVECHGDEHPEGRAYLRHELAQLGHLERDLVFPEGTEETELKATYDNGILEVRLPLPAEKARPPVTRIPVTKA